MKAALYARKSTDDNDKNPDNKSVARQVERARAYAISKGWSVSDDHIYVDDGISGAEYQNRPGFTRLLTHLKEFSVLVMSEPSRLGRDMLRNAFFVGEIIESGVRIFYYLTDEEEKCETPEQKIMITLKSYAAEVERQKASQRSRDALERKALKGQNTGGRVYGYDNVWVYSDGKKALALPGTKAEAKAFTEYQINENEAKIVRSIFQMYVDGCGLKTIAMTLNGDPRYEIQNQKYLERQTPPSPWKGTGSWSPSSVRGLLYNVRYTGKIPYGKHRKIYKQGTKKRVKQAECLFIDAPHLRIVPEPLWQAARQRGEATRKTYIRNTEGALWGRPGMGAESKYLLTGLARCGRCGANIVVLGRPSGSPRQRRRLFYYGCSYHNNRGSTVCSNNHREQMPLMDTAVLNAIEQQVLTAEAVVYTVEQAIQKVMEKLRQNPDRLERIENEIKRLRRELDRFMAVIANGYAPESVLAQISEREDLIRTLEKERQELKIQAPSQSDLARLKKAAETRLGRFKDLIYSDVPTARQALRQLLPEPLHFNPVVINGCKTYTFEGKTQIGALLDPFYLEMASPRGFEPLSPP